MKIVDHELRRMEIAQIAYHIVAKEGLEAGTIRRLAAELGVSTHAVTHYFSDKDEILLWIYRFMAHRGHAQLEELMDRDPPDLIGGLVAISAVEKFDLWRVYVDYWNRAARNPVLAAEHYKSVEITLGLIEKGLTSLPNLATEARVLALKLLALVEGMSVLLLLGERRLSKEQFVAIVEQEIAAASTARSPIQLNGGNVGRNQPPKAQGFR